MAEILDPCSRTHDYAQTHANARRFNWKAGETSEMQAEEEEGVVDVSRATRQRVFQALLHTEESALMKYSAGVAGPEGLVTVDSKGNVLKRAREGGQGYARDKI